MRRFVLISLAVFLAVAPAAAGNTHVDGLFGLGQSDETDFGVNTTSRIETVFDGGRNYDVTFGHDFDMAWRVEGELSCREADVDSHKLDEGGTLSGSAGEGNSAPPVPRST